jgi:hypothetical protein
MNYKEPPGHVAYMELGEAAPARKRDELAALNGRRGYVIFSIAYGEQFARFQADCVQKFGDLEPAEAGLFDPSSGCLYAHRCRSPVGHDRLVRVDVGLSGGGGDGFGWLEDYRLSGTVIKPGTVFTQPAIVPDRGAGLGMTYHTSSNESGYFQFFSGRPGPADPSHFTIDYEIGVAPTRREFSDPAVAPLVVRGVIDGRLGDDDVVVLRPRGGKFYRNTWWSLNDPLLEAPTTTPTGQ